MMMLTSCEHQGREAGRPPGPCVAQTPDTLKKVFVDADQRMSPRFLKLNLGPKIPLADISETVPLRYSTLPPGQVGLKFELRKTQVRQ